MFVETKLYGKNENDRFPEKDMFMSFSISWSSVNLGENLGDNLGDNLGEAFLGKPSSEGEISFGLLMVTPDPSP